MNFSSKNSLNWSVIGVWGTKFSALIIFFVLANILTPEDFGMVALAIGVSNLFQSMFLSSFGATVIQNPKSTPSYLDTTFWLCLGSSAAICVAFYASAGLVARLTSITGLDEVFRLMAVVVVLNGAAAVQHSLLIRTTGFRALAFRSLGAILVSGAAGITAALYGLGWLSLVIQQITVASLNCILLWAASGWRPRFRFSVADAKDSLNFSKWMFLWSILSFFERQTDIVVISSVIGAAAAGYYSTGQRTILLLFELLRGLVSQLFFPIFAQLQDKQDELAEFFCQSVKSVSIFMLPACAGLACVAPEAIVVLLGEKWLPSVPVLRWLTLYGAVASVCFFNFTLMTALNKPRWVASWTGVMMGLNIVLMLPAVYYGFSAVAAVLALGSLAVMPLSIFSVKRLVPLSLPHYLKSFIPVFLATSGMASAILLTRALAMESLSPFWQLLFSVMLGVIIYFGILRIFFPRFLKNSVTFLQSLNK